MGATFYKQNPCLLAGFPVYHPYKPGEIESAFAIMYDSTSKQYCLRYQNFTKQLVSSMPHGLSNGVWKDNFRYFFDLV